MSTTQREESPSQRALADVLANHTALAEALRTQPVREGGQPIHRTKLWVYSTGRGKPNVETAAFIERVTNELVPANGWETDVVASDSEPPPAGTPERS